MSYGKVSITDEPTEGISVTPVDEQLVEMTWKEVAAFSPARARQEMLRLGKKQPNLLAFVTTYLDELHPEAKELGVYVFFVVYRMFEKAERGKVKRISAKRVSDAYDRNETLLMKLEGAHDRFFERVAGVEVSSQPHVMKYVVDTLMEFGEAPDDVVLTDDEIGTLFLVLKTAVDALGEAAKHEYKA